MNYLNSREFALELDRQDPLSIYRERYHQVKDDDGKELIYFCGNSLGLQPRETSSIVNQMMDDWKELAVEGHFMGDRPWMHAHESLATSMARIVGANQEEVVMMNGLTANLHLMMVSFYRPTKDRYKIMIEKGAFPSDQYAVKSQLEFHGFDPDTDLIELTPKKGETLLRTEDIIETIKKEGGKIALILLGGINYYTGQVYELEKITRKGHEMGCVVGFDLAHAAGNVLLKLHDWEVDFAVWCTYKYLNSGPGGLAGCFVHAKHRDAKLPRFAGWWGQNKKTRFLMGDTFDPVPGAEGWLLSNSPALLMASLRASLNLFDEVGMQALRTKSEKLTGFLEFLIRDLNKDRIEIISPMDPDHRGAQLSIRVKGAGKDLFNRIRQGGVIGDWREPDVIRVAPVPMYNSFVEVYEFVQILKDVLTKG